MSTGTRDFSVPSLVLRSLAYYWRSNLAVMAGVAVAVAVLVGSLLVGDSVAGSLRAIALERIGQVDYAVTSTRPIPDDLADRIMEQESAQQAAESIVPALLQQGAVRPAEPGNGEQPAVSNVQIMGVPAGFWDLGQDGPSEPPTRRNVVINQTLADDLEVSAGDSVLLNVGRAGQAPVASVFGRRDPSESLQGIRAVIAEVIPTEGVGYFSLRPIQERPRNLYVDMEWFQQRTGREGQVNTILVSGRDDAESPLAKLREAMMEATTLADYGLELVAGDWGRQLQASNVVVPQNVEQAVDEAGLLAQRTSVYLANDIRLSGQDSGIPYSVVAGVRSIPGVAGQGQGNWLAEGEIALNRWAADDLGAEIGDTVQISYFRSTETGDLIEETAEFDLVQVVPLEGAAADPNLVPTLEGMTDADNMSELDMPFAIDFGAIRPKDDEYWEHYRTAPKAYVRPETVKQMWQVKGLEFDHDWVTSLVLSPEGGGLSGAQLATRIKEHLQPWDYGLEFRPVREQALERAEGSTEFGMLFVSMSFFLVIAAAALVGLLMRLTIERRASQFGILISTGFTPARAASVLRWEGVGVALCGIVIGAPLGLAYAWGLIWGLSNRWQGAVADLALNLHVTPASIIGGALGGFFVALIAMVWATRMLKKSAALDLLAGWRALSHDPTPSSRRRSALIAAIALVGGGLLVALGLAEVIDRTGAFFGGGSGLLIGFLALVYARLSSASTGQSDTALSLRRLAWRGAARNRVRSLLTVGLVACASFIIVTVAASRRDVSQLNTTNLDSGGGGFAVQARTDVGVHYDLSRPAGREQVFGANSELAEAARIFSLRISEGDDASCLNMQRPETPAVMGVPPGMYEKDRFGFTKLSPRADQLPEDANPWHLLEQDLDAGEGTAPVIPAFADSASAQWILKVGIGDEVEVPGLGGRTVRLRIVGLLQPSVFQGVLLVGEANFRRHFGSESGYRFFLVDVPGGEVEQTVRALRTQMGEFGVAVRRTSEVLASYARVQNTYLATFRTLGGLGLLLGTFGIVAVLLRSVIERRREMAMLMAVGLRRRSLSGMIILENGMLLILGIIVGGAAALVAVAPHLASAMADVNGTALALTLAACLVVGLVSCAIAASLSMQGDLLPALRSE